MNQVTEFRIGYHEPIYGKNDSLEEVLEFIRNAAVGKKMKIKVLTYEKDED